MSKISQMQGTPWHIEKYTRKEGDNRRHKHRCKYYNKTEYCKIIMDKCTGSAHCKHYYEDEIYEVHDFTDEKEYKIPKKAKLIPIDSIKVDNDKLKRTSKDEIDKILKYYEKNKILDKPIVISQNKNELILEDGYAIYCVAKKLNLSQIYAINKTNNNILKNARLISINNIKVDNTKFKKPSKKKINRLLKYYEDNKKLDKPIIISCNNNEFILEDGYTIYCVAKKLNLSKIYAIVKKSKNKKLNFNIGDQIYHKHFGHGNISKVESKRITIKFTSGKEGVFDIKTCTKNNLLTFIK